LLRLLRGFQTCPLSGPVKHNPMRSQHRSCFLLLQTRSQRILRTGGAFVSLNQDTKSLLTGNPFRTSHTRTIIGASVGGAVALISLAFLVLWLRRRKQKREELNDFAQFLNVTAINPFATGRIDPSIQQSISPPPSYMSGPRNSQSLEHYSYLKQMW
jgi:hypothetical protein